MKTISTAKTTEYTLTPKGNEWEERIFRRITELLELHKRTPIIEPENHTREIVKSVMRVIQAQRQQAQQEVVEEIKKHFMKVWEKRDNNNINIAEITNYLDTLKSI